MIGAKRHEFPIIGSSFGPGISEYGRMCEYFVDSLSLIISAETGLTSFGKILMADEKAVRFTSELAAVRVPILFLIFSYFSFYSIDGATLFVLIFFIITVK